MSNIVDVGGFLVTFPIWVNGNASGKIDEIETAVYHTGEQAVLIYTDRAAAESTANLGRPAPGEFGHTMDTGSVLIEMADPLAFLGLICVLQTRGTSHVRFDPYRNNGTTFEISTVIECFAKEAVFIHHSAQ